MKLEEILELYSLVSQGAANVAERKQSRALRKIGLENLQSGQGFTKIAFDTRRIDQETEYNPRRGLQNYNRTDPFISDNLHQKIKNFAKLRSVLSDLKNIYGKTPEWQDSNARVLLTSLDNGLRVVTGDEDFAENQPGLGSFDYLEELLHVRYRLGFDDLTRMGETELQKVILAKDEELTRKDVKSGLISKGDVAHHGYDTLIEKLLDGCKASAENPDVERTITITIRDRFHKEG